MKPQDIQTLKILKELETNATISQRTLAQRLGVSLGLVNTFLKRLAKKGYFKISALSKKRLVYILTPKGIAEKTRLTYEYLEYSMNLYKKTYTNLKNAFKEIEDSGIHDFGIFGIGELAEIVCIVLTETKLKLTHIVDPENVGQVFYKHKVSDISDLSFSRPSKMIICDFKKFQRYKEAIQKYFDESSLITVPF
jgi:DNA-binding Lrp family transcriptional regulator